MGMELRALSLTAVIVRILAAVIIGGIIGLERGLKNRPAGLRTYMLVCVGSCLIMLTNQYIYQITGTGDPVRMGAQVVSGIGFLGAGTIVVTRRSHIKGLTTAAGLWSAAGVGLALGIGFYEAALAAGLMIFVILTILQRMDDRMRRSTRVFELYVELKESVSLGSFLRRIREMDLEMTDVQFEPDSVMAQDVRGFVATMKSQKRQNHFLVMENIRKLEGVVHVEEL